MIYSNFEYYSGDEEYDYYLDCILYEKYLFKFKFKETIDELLYPNYMEILRGLHIDSDTIFGAYLTDDAKWYKL